MSDIFRVEYFCILHNFRFSESQVLKHIKTNSHHSIIKIYQFKRSSKKDYFHKKLESSIKYLQTIRTKNKSKFEKYSNEKPKNLHIIEKIYQNVENFIEKKLKIFKNIEKMSFYFESAALEIKKIMNEKLFVNLDYENFKNIEPLEFQVKDFTNYKVRKSLCLKKLRSKMVTTPSCAVFYKNYSNLIIGYFDSTIRCLNIKNQTFIFTLTLHFAKITTLTVYQPSESTQGSSSKLVYYLISCSEDKRIIIWDLGLKKCLKILKNHKYPIETSDINSLRTLFITSDGSWEILLWSLSDWKCLRTIPHQSSYLKEVKFISNEDLLFCYIEKNLNYSTNNTIFILKSKETDPQIFHPSIVLEYQNQIQFLEVSNCRSFIVYLISDQGGYCIKKFTINNRNKETIHEMPNDQFICIKLDNSNKFLLAFRQFNALVLNLETRKFTDIQTTYQIQIALTTKNEGEFYLINRRHYLNLLDLNHSNKKILPIKICKFYNFESYQIDQKRGLVHLLDGFDYLFYDVRKNVISKKITGKFFTCITFNPLNGDLILASSIGEVFLIKFQDNEDFFEKLTSTLNEDMRLVSPNDEVVSEEYQGNSIVFEKIISYNDLLEDLKKMKNFKYSSPLCSEHTGFSNVSVMKVSDSGLFLVIGFFAKLEVVFEVKTMKTLCFFWRYQLFQSRFYQFYEKKGLLLSASSFMWVIYDLNTKKSIYQYESHERYSKVRFSFDHEHIFCFNEFENLSIFTLYGEEVSKNKFSSEEIQKFLTKTESFK